MSLPGVKTLLGRLDPPLQSFHVFFQYKQKIAHSFSVLSNPTFCSFYSVVKTLQSMMSWSAEKATPTGLESHMHLSLAWHRWAVCDSQVLLLLTVPSAGSTTGQCLFRASLQLPHSQWLISHFCVCQAGALVAAACHRQWGGEQGKVWKFSVWWNSRGGRTACCRQSWLCKSHWKALLWGKQRGGKIPSVLLWEVWNEKLNLQVQVQDLSSTSTQNPNVFQMSLGFKWVSEDLTKETKCEGSSVLTLQWLPQALSVTGLGPAMAPSGHCCACTASAHGRPESGASLECVVQLSNELGQDMA